MDFSLNDDQKMLRDSVQRYVNDTLDLEAHRSRIKQLDGVDQGQWQQFAELGWLALPFAEEDGGLGFGLPETMIVMEELGKGLLTAPWVPTVVLGGGCLRRATEAQREQYLTPLLEGRLQMALAVDEPDRVFGVANTALAARRDGGRYVLRGSKQTVLNGDQADLFAVVARTAGEPGEDAGISLFLVPADREGIRQTPHRLVDGQQAATVIFDDVTATTDELLGAEGEASALVDAVITEGILAFGAQAVGVADRLLWDTVEYTQNRKQFGVPIGSFQALQHRMVDMFMAAEQGRSLLLAATLKTAEGHADADQAVHAFKVWLGRGGRRIGQEAIQLHGGMGMTDEMAVGHYFKRLTAVDLLFGTADEHLKMKGARS